ncbi:DinB family protein [Mucilaginibacter sp.]|uniref:DinB family protein n=1 Tax=Mucilaginibacter sp. TaxID=1882438 RepID=UPI0035BBB3A1
MINPPQPNEYQAYFETYVSKVPRGADVMELLEQLQTTTYNLFSNMTEMQSEHAYAKGKWTIKQVLGHIIDTERVFAFRAFCFSRENAVLPGFDQDVYVNNTDFNSRPIQSLATELRATRESNLYLFGNLTANQLDRMGTASGNPVSVKALVYMAAGHELHHLQILKERYL